MSGVPVVRQKRGNDCGPAALAAIAAYYGCAFDYDDLSRETALDRHGTDLLVLSRIAEGLGLRAQGIKASYDAISRCTLPAIAHLRFVWGGGHFVVLHRWTSAHVVVADPARGARTLSRKSFCRRATGYLLLVQPDQRTTTAERCALRTNALVEGGRAESIGAVAERCRT